MKKINGWLYAFWIALIVILIMALAVGLIAWAGSGAEESEGSGTVEEEPGDDDGDSEIVGENTLTIEAEDAALFNSMSSSASNSTLIGTEETTLSDNTVITNVKNFNTAGDKIVFQVLASAAIENVTIDVTACCAMLALFSEQTFADNDKILTVNGGDPIILSGTLTNPSGSFAYNNYGTLTGTISLNSGINYIEITAASTNTSGYLNVDKIDLSWDGEATIEAVNDYTGEVFDVDATGVATMEAEDAALMNGVSSTTGTTASLMGVQTSTSDNTTVCVSNFDTTGDKIVFQVNAVAAVSVQIDLVASTTYFLGTTLDVSTIPNLLTVNGTAVTLTGTLTNSAFSFYDFVTVTATGVSFNKGINYIVLDYQDNNMNVDRIDLNGGTTAEAEPELETTEVSTADELTAAVALGGEIVLTDDIELSAALEIEADVALDLAGNTVSAGDVGENTIEVANGTLTISDSTGDGAIENTYATAVSNNNAAAIEVDGGDLIIESGTIESTSVGVRALEGSVTIDGGTVTSSGYYALWESEGTVDVVINDGVVGGSYAGILVDGDSNFGYTGLQENAVTTLTVNGGVVYSGGEGQAAIRTESMTSTGSAVITINGGLVYGAAKAPGIFLGNGTLKITDGIIAGSTAVEVQAGDVTISGGVFYATDDEQKITYTTSNSASFTNGYALSIIPRGNVWRVASDETFSIALDVTITGGTFYGDVYVAATSVLADTDGSTWTVVLNGTDEDKASANYVVDITGITLTPYDSNNNPISDQSTTAAYYLYAVDSKLAAIDSANDADDLKIDETNSVAGYDYEIVISTDASDGSVKYTLVGEAGTMDADLASWFGNGAQAGDAYVTVKIYVGADNTLTYTSAGGETKIIDSSNLTSEGYYIFAYRLTGTLDDGTAVSPSSAKVYTVKDSSDNVLYTVTIDYTQITITEAV